MNQSLQSEETEREDTEGNPNHPGAKSGLSKLVCDRYPNIVAGKPKYLQRISKISKIFDNVVWGSHQVSTLPINPGVKKFNIFTEYHICYNDI